MKRGTYAVLTFLLLLLGCALYSLQLRLDSGRDEKSQVEEFTYLPRAEYLGAASLGNQSLLADLLWLKAVQHMGERKITDLGYDWIYRALDTVTTLDPKFMEPYEAGGLILSVGGDHADLSIKLLKKGVGNIPDVWQLPFYLGFNYYFYVKDYKEAARYMEMAASKPGSPPYLPLLASRLYVQAEDPAYALQFLTRMYENAKDENMRENLAARIKLMKAAVDIKALQDAVDGYAAKHGRRPGDIGDLVLAGLIPRIPEEPDGGRYYIDKDGKVKSSRIKQNLGVYGKWGQR